MWGILVALGADASSLPRPAPWLLLAAAAAAVALYFAFSLRGWKHGLRGPPGHWLLGNLDVMVGGQLHENLSALIKDYGPLFPMRVLTTRAMVLSDPASISKLLKGGAATSVKLTRAYFMFDKMTYPKTESILTAEDGDPYWKVVRSAAAQAFATKNLKLLFPSIVDSTLTAMQCLPIKSDAAGSPASVDMDEVFLRVTVDILGGFLLGRSFGASAGQECHTLEVVENECKVIGSRIKNPYRTWLIWKKEVRQEERWNCEFAALIRSMLAEMRASPPPAHTLGAQLLATKDPRTGGALPEARLCSELALFVMGGFENTGHSTSLALFSIIIHEGVQERVCAELESLGLLATPANPTPRRLEWGDLGKLRVLSAAVEESMRWLPVVPTGTIRKLKKDVEVLGTRLRKGTEVWVPLIAPHRDPRNWERPDEYDIDRWLGGAGAAGLMDGLEDAEHTTSKGSRGYLPFSEGPRNCVGQALARVEVLAVLALLLGSFHVQLAPEMGGREGVLKSLDSKLSLRPDGGLWCRLTPRVPS